MRSNGMLTSRLLTISHSIHGGGERGCVPACIGQGVYPSMHWTGGESQHTQGRGFVSQHALGRGVSSQGDVCPGGVCPREVSAWGCLRRGAVSGVGSGRHPTCGQTDTCENIAFANFTRTGYRRNLKIVNSRKNSHFFYTSQQH